MYIVIILSTTKKERERKRERERRRKKIFRTECLDSQTSRRDTTTPKSHAQNTSHPTHFRETPFVSRAEEPARLDPLQCAHDAHTTILVHVVHMHPDFLSLYPLHSRSFVRHAFSTSSEDFFLVFHAFHRGSSQYSDVPLLHFSSSSSPSSSLSNSSLFSLRHSLSLSNSLTLSLSPSHEMSHAARHVLQRGNTLSQSRSLCILHVQVLTYARSLAQDAIISTTKSSNRQRMTYSKSSTRERERSYSKSSTTGNRESESERARAWS